MTDRAALYRARLRRRFASHNAVDHSQKEYARYGDGRPVIHSNTVEGYFSVIKRGIRGTHQHCKEKHLHRCLAQFDFRYNARVALGVNDDQRAQVACRREGQATDLSNSWWGQALSRISANCGTSFGAGAANSPRKERFS